MANTKQLDYKALSAELEVIVAKLQAESTSIEDALELYERGVVLVKEMDDYLKHAKNRLNKISKEMGEL